LQFDNSIKEFTSCDTTSKEKRRMKLIKNSRFVPDLSCKKRNDDDDDDDDVVVVVVVVVVIVIFKKMYYSNTT
jgi:hypothetical protein